MYKRTVLYLPGSYLPYNACPLSIFLLCTLGGIASWWQNSFGAYHTQVMKVCHYRYHYRGTYQGELEKNLEE